MKKVIDELDLAKLMTFQERVQRLKAEAQLTQLQFGQASQALQALTLELRQKYELGPADSINPDTRAIVRGVPAGVVTADQLVAAAAASAAGAATDPGDRQG